MEALNADKKKGGSHSPLSKEFLIKRGTCCGSGCRNCPYEPQHTKGSKKLMDECFEWAGKISEKSPIAMEYALRAIKEGLEVDLETGLKIEGLCLGACFASEDSKEGLNAFLEKRKPQYKRL